VDDRLGGVGAPQGFGLVGIEGHGQHVLAAALGGHGIPDELARRGEGDVAHVIRLETPGFGTLRFFLLVGVGLRRLDDEGQLARLARLFEAALLRGREYFVGILQDAGGGHDVVGGHGDFQAVIAQLQGELAAAQELLVLPALVVGIAGHARVPLGNFVDVVLVLGKVLVAAARANGDAVEDVVLPVDAEGKGPSRLQRRRQVEAHHGFDDLVGEWVAVLVGHFAQGDATLEFPACQHVGQGPVGKFLEVGRRVGEHVVRVRPETVLVQLQPDIGQGVRRQVVVGHAFAAANLLDFVIEGDGDPVVGPLLPIAGTRCAGGGPGARGRRQQLSQLCELGGTGAGTILVAGAG